MKRMRITEALLMSPDDREDLDPRDIDMSDAELQGACRVWLKLSGVDDDGSDRARAWRAEVMGDAPLIIILNAPAADFLDWFRAESWNTFKSPLRPDLRAWGRGVLRRAIDACDSLGSMSAQVPMRA